MTPTEPNSSTAPPALEAIDLGKSYDGRVVFTGINLTITPGQSVCICGPNGSGKSTLLRIAAGLTTPTAGKLRICGRDIRSDSPRARTLIGLIAHTSMLYDDLTVAENLLFYARLYALENPRARIDELIDQLGLAPYRHDSACILSRGMLQRLAIARALTQQPRVLLADEPFTGLDANAAEHLTETLRNFPAHDRAVIMTSHNPPLALTCCQRIAVLDQGSIILDAPASELQTSDFTNDYLAYTRSRA